MFIKSILLGLVATMLPMSSQQTANSPIIPSNVEQTAENFVCSATFAFEGKAGFTFGKTQSSQYSVVADASDRSIAIFDKSGHTVKSSVDLIPERDYRLSLIMNQSVAKVYVDHSLVASIVCPIKGYSAGYISYDGPASHKEFFSTDTCEADIFLGGYSLSGVINIDDDNELLDPSSYTFENGLLSISESYLKTLENEKTYTFSAVTDISEFNFEIENDFAGVQARTSRDVAYHGYDLHIDLSKDAEVYRVTIDGKDVAFSKNGKRVTIEKDVVDTLDSGDYLAKLYTDNGRPEVNLSISDIVQTYPEVPAPVSHVFLWIDIAIFAGLIGGYLGFSAYKKRKEKGGQ